MKIIIFAGGTGTRFWPLSRRDFPKQFKKIFNGDKKQKSTLQLAVDRLEKTFGTDNIYISTNENYVTLVKEQVPQIPTSNIIAEPLKRNVGPAVGFALINLRKMGYKGPIALLWADHLIDRVDQFIGALQTGKNLVYKNPKQLVMISEEPRYAENNLGWIHIGKNLTDSVYEFKGWKYRPELDDCKTMFESGEWKWNPGYFVSDLDFILNLYETFQPQMYRVLKTIELALGTVNESSIIHRNYPKLEAIHFDTAIAERVSHSDAVVVTADMGWSDPGTLYALKEALIGRGTENLAKGRVFNLKTTDSVMINEDKDKLIAVYGLDGVVLVNTKDAMIVTHKDNIAKMSELVEALEKSKDYHSFT